MDRRSFIRMIMAAPAVKAIDIISPAKSKSQKLPKALLVDPFQINMEDISRIKNPDLKGVKIIRLRRFAWGRGEPIRKVF